MGKRRGRASRRRRSVGPRVGVREWGSNRRRGRNPRAMRTMMAASLYPRQRQDRRQPKQGQSFCVIITPIHLHRYRHCNNLGNYCVQILHERLSKLSIPLEFSLPSSIVVTSRPVNGVLEHPEPTNLILTVAGITTVVHSTFIRFPIPFHK